MGKVIVLIVVLISTLALLTVSSQFCSGQSSNAIINSDGSITGTNSIRQIGNVYFLTTNISGSIQVQKSNILVKGAGFALTGEGVIDLTNDVQHQPTRPAITNVTIENLIAYGVETNGGGNDTFYDDYILNGIDLMASSYNNVTFCMLGSLNHTSSPIGFVLDADYNSVTENNVATSSWSGLQVYLSWPENVDNNYWSDYSTKYPNATEIDNSGIDNQPYAYSEPQGNLTNILYFQDNHPLMSPVAIPLPSSINPTPQATIPEFPAVIIISLVVIATTVAMFVKRKTAC